jgi:NAD(P)-dependent dehydrogenase (short-subunit alcohol dehydrogenase family)
VRSLRADDLGEGKYRHMLKNKVVVITGGAGLLGREFIRAVVENNGVGIIADVHENAGGKAKNALLQEVESKCVEFIHLDITAIQSVENLIQNVHSKYGRIDAWINSAYPRNKDYGNKFFNVSYESFCQNINLNLGGYFLCSQQISKYFIKQGHGNIINIASIYGVVAPKFELYENTKMSMPVEYAVIKSALIHFTKYLAKYLKGKHIRVNAISPGGIFDNQSAQFVEKYTEYCLNKGMLDPKDITGTLIFLLSDISEFINGQNIVVDDGFVL